MNNVHRAYLASVVCLAGATIQIIYGLLAIPFGPYTEMNAGWDEIFWALVNVGFIAGALGLLFLDVGRPRWLAVIGAAVSVLASLSRIVASIMIIAGFGEDTITPFILASILLSVPGMGALGIATLLGKQLRGWQAWTPLLAEGCVFVIAPTYSINLYLHFILLGMWGVAWLLVGYVVFTHAAKREQGTNPRVVLHDL